LKEQVIKILTEENAQAAVAFLKEQEDPQLAADTFNAVMRHAYWEMHDLDSTVKLAKEGIAYASEKAKEAEDKAQAAELNNFVKAISYNLASFTWPGWDEDWIESISGEYLKLGLDAAHTNLHLAIELERGDLAVSRAHWMLGAQQIASGKYQEARENFSKSIEFAEKAEAHSDVLLSHGFLHVVSLLENPTDEDARSSLEAIRSELVNLEHGEMLAQQMDDTFNHPL
jgi:tetratricopeptide (TPR) repeat protein